MRTVEPQLSAWRRLTRSRLMRVWLPIGTVVLSLALVVLVVPVDTLLCEIMFEGGTCDH